MGLSSKTQRSLTVLLLVIVICVCGYIGWVNLEFSKVRMNPIVSETDKKFWSHRGLWTTLENQNTLYSIHSAIGAGFKGVEIDVIFDEPTDKFVVSHDEPYKLQENGEVLTLDKVFEQIQPQIYFWLDFKNLNKANLDKATKRLEILSSRYNNKPYLLVESREPYSLQSVAEQGFYTCYWVGGNYLFKPVLWRQPRAFINWLIEETERRSVIANSGFNCVSQSYHIYEQALRESYSHLNVHVWTNDVSDHAIHKRLAGYPEISVILVDGPLPKIKN